MATFAPVSLNKSTTDTVPISVGSNGTPTPPRSISHDVPRTSLRGMNKPKCIKCGNIARSRCDFQSCKGCCAKAQNPCLIHVLKQTSSTLPEKPPPSASPLPEQPSGDVLSKGASTRLSSLRQLSSNYMNSLRVKRPLSCKDALAINKWRFRKLREYMDGNLEAEDEAFDRYVQNVSLLEETFSMEKATEDLVVPPMEEAHHRMVSALKAKLQASIEGSQIHRQRIQEIIDRGLGKLQKSKFDDVDLDEEDHDTNEFRERKKLMTSRAERSTEFNDLLDKLTKARTEEDLKPLLDLRRKLHGESYTAGQVDYICSQKMTDTQETSNPLDAVVAYSVPELCKMVQSEQDIPSAVEGYFLSLDQIIQL